MKYVKFSGGNGYSGCDFEEYISFSNDFAEMLFYGILYNKIYENAESHDYVVTDYDGEFESVEARDEYYANCKGKWEYVSKEEFEKNRGKEWERS